MSFLVRAYRQAGRIDDGLRVLDDAQASIDARGERWWEAEIRRLRGELILSRSAANAEDALPCFKQALDISRQQDAKSLELRAATSLARLWKARGETDRARDLLASTYGWFSEGFATRDLKEAKALLNELS
jgi:predicted ATPase